MFAVPSGDTMRPVGLSVITVGHHLMEGITFNQKEEKKLQKEHEIIIMIQYQFIYFTNKTTNLFFKNEDIFVQLDELDKLDKIIQA